MDKSGERLNMLQRNNQQLSAELARVREENLKLEKSLADMRNKQVEYTDTLAAVDRTWQQLNQDMVYLSRRLKCAPRSLIPTVFSRRNRVASRRWLCEIR